MILFDRGTAEKNGFLREIGGKSGKKLQIATARKGDTSINNLVILEQVDTIIKMAEWVIDEAYTLKAMMEEGETKQDDRSEKSGAPEMGQPKHEKGGLSSAELPRRRLPRDMQGGEHIAVYGGKIIHYPLY